MFTMLVMLVGVGLFEPVSGCRQKEYPNSDGWCCPMCKEGTVVSRDCSADSGTLCAPCEKGTYMNRPNGLRRCLSCSTCDQGLGLYAKENCKLTADSLCDVLSGFFCKSLTDSTGCSAAEKHSVCKPGERIKQPGTSRHDTVCEACQQGSFSPDGVNCTLWTKCSENQTQMRDGTLTADVVCSSGSSRHRYFLLLPFVSVSILCLMLVQRFIVFRATN